MGSGNREVFRGGGWEPLGSQERSDVKLAHKPLPLLYTLRILSRGILL